MEFEKYEKKEKIEINGFIEKGKQFDLDIVLPDDNRNVIFGIIKDCYGEPVVDAVVKLIEVDEKCGPDERKPVTHTFTDENGEFVFGPLCPHKKYAIDIWADHVDHIKICEICKRKGKCLKGIKLECEEKCREEHKKDYKEDYKDDYKDDYKEDYKKDCKCNYKKDEEKKEDKKDDKKEYEEKYDKKY